MRLRKPCEHGRYDPHIVDPKARKPVWCPGGEFLPEAALVPAWIGETNVEEVSDLVWDDHAHLIDVRKMDPIWVLPRKVEVAADQVGEPG